MDYLNGLNYKWIHYGPELFGNHVRRQGAIGIGRDNWPPQGNRNTATKVAPDVWLINSVTTYDDEPGDIYYCWFFTTIHHEKREIYYKWIKGNNRPHSWTLRGSDKNAAIVFDDCPPSNRLKTSHCGYYEGDKEIIPLEPLLAQVRTI